MADKDALKKFVAEEVIIANAAGLCTGHIEVLKGAIHRAFLCAEETKNAEGHGSTTARQSGAGADHGGSATRVPSAPAEAPLGCLDCGKLYVDFPLDSTLPDEQWRMIHDSEGGILCANCMVARAAKLTGAIAMRLRIEFAEKNSEAPTPKIDEAKLFAQFALLAAKAGWKPESMQKIVILQDRYAAMLAQREGK